MKKFLKIAAFVVGGIVILALGGVLYLNMAFPKVSPAQDMKIQATPEMIEHGKYLANHVTGCMDCHSTRDWTKFAGPLVPGTEGKGGEEFQNIVVGFPGKLTARNLTPFNLKNWTDGEIYRAITTGVTKDGRALFPLMPYPNFAHMDPDDIKAVIAYLRSLPEIESPNYPYADLNFPLNLIVKTIPHDVAAPGSIPERSDTLKYGEYLVTIAGCAECHTPREKGEPIKGMDFAGGMEFKTTASNDIIRSANITQDYETGIGLWTEDVFLGKFKTYRDSSWHNKPVKPGEMTTVMPWLFFSGMKDEDLKAIFRYLKTIPPITHKVEKFTAAK